MVKSDQEIIDDIVARREQRSNETDESKSQLSMYLGLRDYLKELFKILIKWFRKSTLKVKEVNPIKKITVLNFPKYQKIKGRVEIKEWNAMLTAIAQVNKKLESLLNKPELELPETQKIKGEVTTDVKIPSYPKPYKRIEVSNLRTLRDELRRLRAQVRKIKLVVPRPPKYPEQIEVSNLKDLEKHFTNIYKALARLEAKEIEFPDNSEIIDSTDSIKEAINNLQFPVPNFQHPDKMAGYNICRVDESDPAYRMWVNDQGQWVLQKEDAGVFKYCKGSGDIAGYWTARADQTYVEFNDVEL